MLGTAPPVKKRVRLPSLEGAPPSSRLRRVEGRRGRKTRCPSPETSSSSFQHERTEDVTTERPGACIQDLPPEIMEVILGHLSPCDVMSFGATCARYHQQNSVPWVWKSFCSRMPGPSEPSDWQRLAILKHTQALHTQRLGPAQRGSPGTRSRRSQPPTSRAMELPEAHGYRRVVPAWGSVLLWDYQGTLHLLRHDGAEGLLSQPNVLCHNVKDFAVDPRNDARHRDHVYVLANPQDVSQGTSRVTFYGLGTGAPVFRMTFHPSLAFAQICLTGTKIHRQLLLLSGTGAVYGLSLNEANMLLRWHNFSVHMTRKIMSVPQGPLSIRQVQSSQNSALYLSGDGTVCLEVYSPALYKKMFGDQQVCPALHAPVHLPLPTKVVKCSLGPSHICLVDERGGIFTQGDNSFGQLGTGDRVDRRQLTQVSVSMRPVDVWCGPNHTLVLLQDESGAKELHGCGFGAAGRLPGHPKGSDVLVKLNVLVPRASRSICAVKNCLYIMSSHDIDEALFDDGHN
ncbi:unnamed protein product [Arctogadus glacialis]